jgi:hypothetical protein
MICDFITRSNRANIKSHYLMNTTIICYLSYNMNISITATFGNQPLRCHAFILFPPENYPHNSCAIFHINHYNFCILTVVPYSTNKLNHVKRATVFLNKPFGFVDGGMNHLCGYLDESMLTIVQMFFFNFVLDGFRSLMKDSSLMNHCHLYCLFLKLVLQTMLPSPSVSFQ